ncbi:hypothetical protein [Nocardia sp. NPDC059239]|uniref:hypothetical protein n=1 Tax=unclassified Nocardia TaxID=2637762 RepID=UPI00367DCC31
MRIRSIKPEFWRSDDIDALDWHHRLVFIGLWSYVDDNGVGLDKLASICADLFASDMERDPSETLNRVSTALNLFVERGLIQRYSVDGKAFLFITGWSKHQRVVNPNNPRYPVPTSENAVTREGLTTSSRESNETLAPGTGEQRNRGEESSPTENSCSTAAPPNVTPPARGSGAKARTKPGDPRGFADFWAAYPRRTARGAAVKAYAKAIKTTDPAVLLAAARRYAEDPNRNAEFTCHAATWLNQERWSDEPLPTRGTGNRGPAANGRDQKIADLERFKTNPNPAILNAFGGPPNTGVPSGPMRPPRALPGGSAHAPKSPAAYQPPLLGEVS